MTTAAPLPGHQGRTVPVTASVEYHGEHTAFGQPMLRLVVGTEWIGMTSDAALDFATRLQVAALGIREES